MLSFAPWTPRRSRLPVSPGAAEVATLVGRLLQGDRAALGELYESEATAVYRYALALCGNTAWAADAVQEAFIALAARPEGFDAARGALGAYLAGIARHALAAQRHELRLHEPLPEDDEPDASSADAAIAPEAVLVQRQSGEQVWAALRALPAVFREALVLVDLQERPYAEAAQIAGIELNTLRTRVHRARQKLAALLGAANRSTP